MKQLKTILFSLPLVLAAVGCSQEELLPDGGKGTGASEGLHEVVVTFNMGTSGGLQTRSIQRPVISSDNWQRVSNVRIYVFKGKDKDGQGNPISTFDPNDDSQYFYYKPTVDGKELEYIYVPQFSKDDDWGEDDENHYSLEVPVWGDDDNAEKDLEQHVFTNKMQLKTGYYKFLVIGRDDISEGGDVSKIVLTEPTMQERDYPSSFFAEDKSKILLDWSVKFKEGKTALNNVILRCGDNTGQATEVFRGISEDIYVTEESQGFTRSIELKRSVAGVLMYVKNIPTSIKAQYNVAIEDKEWGDRKIVVESGKSYTVSNIAIGTIAYSRDVNVYDNQPDGKRAKNANVTEHVVDYYNFSQRYGDKGKFLTSYLTDTEDGYTYYKIDHSTDQYAEDTTLCDNSVLAGGFFLPQDAPTEELQIYGDEDDENILTLDGTLYLVFFTQFSGSSYPFYWIPIKCEYDYTYNGDTDDYTGPTEHIGDAYKFPIKANCFYSLGSRNYKKNINEPIDLKKHFDKEEGGDNSLVITVNPDWDWKGELEWAD